MSAESKIEQISKDLHKVGLGVGGKGLGHKSMPAVADSWEDDASGSDHEGPRSPLSDKSNPVEAPGPTHLKSPTTRAVDAERDIDGSPGHRLPSVPPPTPISPQIAGVKPLWSPAKGLDGSRPVPSPGSGFSSPRSTPPTNSINPTPRHGTPETDRESDRRRPEKTTATANRLIAGALGIKAPPKTEEQRKYEKAVKEQEIKRRNKEREQKAKEAEEDEKAKTAVWES